MSKICLMYGSIKMNLLSSGVPLNWRRNIWRNSYPWLEIYNIKTICLRKPNTKKNTDFFSHKRSNVCWKRHQIGFLPELPKFISWNQVRLHKDYPKLHRDIAHPNFDPYRKEKFKDLSKTTWHSGDEKYGYTYVVSFFGLVCGMYSLKTELTHFLLSMAAPADVLALATIEIDIANIPLGMCNSYKWRGKPLFIKHRTPAEISAEANTPLSNLRDPQTPEERTVNPEWLIVIGICTHLGCVPIPNSGDWTGGFYCPCHGSHYDNIGRTRKGPAPLNLEVPPYKFITDTLVLVG